MLSKSVDATAKVRATAAAWPSPWEPWATGADVAAVWGLLAMGNNLVLVAPAIQAAGLPPAALAGQVGSGAVTGYSIRNSDSRWMVSGHLPCCYGTTKLSAVSPTPSHNVGVLLRTLHLAGAGHAVERGGQ
jgi:hypothetical protein